MELAINKIVQFNYKNYKGSHNVRTVVPVEIWFGSTKYHTKDQWLLKAYDLDKMDYRDFALKDIENWEDN
jgi:predicted DNA-binding transcriptional regulator YafY